LIFASPFLRVSAYNRIRFTRRNHLDMGFSYIKYFNDNHPYPFFRPLYSGFVSYIRGNPDTVWQIQERDRKRLADGDRWGPENGSPDFRVLRSHMESNDTYLRFGVRVSPEEVGPFLEVGKKYLFIVEPSFLRQDGEFIGYGLNLTFLTKKTLLKAGASYGYDERGLAKDYFTAEIKTQHLIAEGVSRFNLDFYADILAKLVGTDQEGSLWLKVCF